METIHLDVCNLKSNSFFQIPTLLTQLTWNAKSWLLQLLMDTDHCTVINKTRECLVVLIRLVWSTLVLYRECVCACGHIRFGSRVSKRRFTNGISLLQRELIHTSVLNATTRVRDARRPTRYHNLSTPFSHARPRTWPQTRRLTA